MGLLFKALLIEPQKMFESMERLRGHLSAVDFKEAGEDCQVVFLVLGIKQPKDIAS